jgi:anaphase-promoting complex subunit 2
MLTLRNALPRLINEIPSSTSSKLRMCPHPPVLTNSNLKRLLHPGAETSDVLTQYISTIRCLRILDPPGVLLHKVALPIRQHLRMRQDTTKCIVAALVEGEDLTDENDGGGGLIKDNNDDEVEDWSDPKWEPEPMDAAPGMYQPALDCSQ